MAKMMPCSTPMRITAAAVKTQMVDSAGGRSQLAPLTTSLLVLLVLLFLTGPLAFLPLAVLATIVFLVWRVRA